MKKSLVIFLSLVAILALATGCSPRRDYVINGNVTGIPDGTMVYLRLVGPPNNDIDSTLVENGKFSFKGVHEGTPEWALIAVKGQFTSLCDFYLDNGDIDITGEKFGTRATGTPINEQYNFYKDSINSMFNEISALHTNIAVYNDSVSLVDSLKARLGEVNAELLDKEVKFVLQYPDSPISLRIVEYISRDAKSDDIVRYVSYLSERQQASEAAKALITYADIARKTEDGAEAPLFTLTDDKGNTVNLSDYRGKYVLVDFWASWCSPCRGSFPLVEKLYKQYSGDKFDILGISLDKEESAWRKALEIEKCPWTMVLDSKGVVAKEYAVSAIPLMILVNPDGTICGKYNQNNIADKLCELFD